MQRVIETYIEEKNDILIALARIEKGEATISLDEIEKKAISNWKDAILKNIDLKKLEDEIAKDEMASYHEDEVFRVYNKSSVLERVHKAVAKIMNAGDYKLPKN